MARERKGRQRAPRKDGGEGANRGDERKRAD